MGGAKRLRGRLSVGDVCGSCRRRSRHDRRASGMGSIVVTLATDAPLLLTSARSWRDARARLRAWAAAPSCGRRTSSRSRRQPRHPAGGSQHAGRAPDEPVCC